MHDRQIVITEDGSPTFFLPALNITYHSRHGAIRESNHIFISAGLEYFFCERKNLPDRSINIFEMGFGTGLNALLTLQFAIEKHQEIFYEAIEAYPLSTDEFLQLNYSDIISNKLTESFKKLHQCNWNETIKINDTFSFKKNKTDLTDFSTTHQFHLIFFDAFDPNTQPGLWTATIFEKLYNMLFPGGILVTYCSKGAVRRAMQAAGFTVEKLKGPPGKREMVRARKNSTI
jgi:tRNA U34 5-methylaminomethyl-2-thiouridine-forming methyltransferase MnmC